MRFSESLSGMRNLRHATYSKRLRCSTYRASTSSAASEGGAGEAAARADDFSVRDREAFGVTSLALCSSTAPSPSRNRSADRCTFADFRPIARYHVFRGEHSPRGYVFDLDASRVLQITFSGCMDMIA